MATKSSASIPNADLASNTVLNDQLNQTEIGVVIAKNKTLAVTLILLLVIGVVGYGFYTSQKEKADHKKADQMFSFMDKNFQSLADGKMAVPVFLSAHQKAMSGLSGFAGLFPTNIIIADELIKKNELAPAQEILESLNIHTTNNYQVILIALRLAAVYEDLGKPELAIEQLEKLNNLKTGILEAKNYLDLGRLYKQLGNTEKAKVNFNYVINNMAQDEFAKLAKLYLSELK
ncbi:MAG: tetratricopeptide repeat protein [Bacteriovoracaceae bacterium]|nr:tetratricopeptide repeat protein [Bacteriovoracaceae bacterium]